MKKLILTLSCLLLTMAMLNPAAAESAAPETPPGGIKSIEERVKALEEAAVRKPEDHKWYDLIRVGGLVEVETSNYKIDYEDEEVPDEKGTPTLGLEHRAGSGLDRGPGNSLALRRL